MALAWLDIASMWRHIMVQDVFIVVSDDVSIHNVSSRQPTLFTIVCKRSRRFKETNRTISLSPLFYSSPVPFRSPSPSPDIYIHYFVELVRLSTIYGLRRLSSTPHIYFVLKFFTQPPLPFHLPCSPIYPLQLLMLIFLMKELCASIYYLRSPPTLFNSTQFLRVDFFCFHRRPSSQAPNTAIFLLVPK